VLQHTEGDAELKHLSTINSSQRIPLKRHHGDRLRGTTR
jgi:hypothetical protein